MGLFDDLITEEAPTGLFDDLIQPDSAKDLPAFEARATGYHPVDPGHPEYRMEGGRVGAEEWHGVKFKQEPLFTLDQYRRGEAPYVSVAMDNTRTNPIPYGSILESPDMPGVKFRVMDTGSAFNGRSPKYGGPKGLSRIDIARDTAEGANSPENNRPLRFAPAGSIDFQETRIEKAKPILVQEMEVRKAQSTEQSPNSTPPTDVPPGMFDDLIAEGKSAEVPGAAYIGEVAGMFDDLVSRPAPAGPDFGAQYGSSGPTVEEQRQMVASPMGQELERVVQGADLASIPKDVALSLTPATEAYHAIKQAYDLVRGGKVQDVIPESQELVGIEKKPLQQRVEAGLKQLLNLYFAGAIGKQAFPKTPPGVPGPVEGTPEMARVDPAAVAAEEQAGRTAGPTGEPPVPQPRPAPETSRVASTVGQLNPGDAFQYREGGKTFYAMAASDNAGKNVRIIDDSGKEQTIPQDTRVIKATPSRKEETSVPITDVPPAIPPSGVPTPPQTLKTFADIPPDFVPDQPRTGIPPVSPEPPISKTVYHGSTEEAPKFQVRSSGNDLGIHFGTAEQADWRVGDKGVVKPYRVEIKNPLRLEDQGGWYGEAAVNEINKKIGSKLSPSSSVGAIRQAIQKAGYDGVVYKNKFEHDLERPSEDSYIVFNEKQIKPADTGTQPVPQAKPTVAVPFGFGPGAAAAGEKLAAYEQRAFAERLQADQSLAGQLRENIGNRYYEPIPNTVTSEQAVEVVNQRGIVQSINAITDPQSPMPFHIRSAIGQIVLKRLNEGFRRLEGTDPVAADELLNRSVEVAEWLEEFGTRLGQGVQSFALWSRLTPEGQLIKVQRAVRRTRERYEGEHPGEVKEIVDASGKPGFSFGQLARTNATAKLVKPLWTKLIDAARQGLLNDQTFYDITSERLGLPKFNKQIAAEIVRLANEIDAAPDGIPKNDAQLKLAKFITRQLGFAPKDLPIGIYYGNMLSGYNTQLVNTVDTLLNVVSEVNGLAIANPRAAASIYRGMVRGFLDGRADFALAITRGRMITDGKWMEVPRLMEAAEFGRKGGVPIRTDTRTGRFMKAISESRPGGILNAWKYVTRLMAASDSLMFRGAYEARIALLSDRLAREEGLSGRALDNRIEQLLGTEAGRMAQHEAQARQEGFSGVAARARRSELRELQRNADHRADAAEFAGVATYNHEPTGFLGYIAKGVGQFSEQYPLMKIFVPFTRIVANVTNRGLNYTPLGFKRAWNEAPGSDARASMIARATFGTAGLTLLGTMQAAGVVQIHGAGPTDPERRRQLQAAGWKAYSLQIGDTFVSYVYSPIGLGLSILGNMTDSARYGELKQGDAVTRGAYAVSRIGSTIFSQSFLSGLSNLFGALSNEPGQVITSLKQTLASTAGTFTTPTIFRDIQRLFDPKRYQANSIAGELLRNTPFASAVNRPALNAFGEPVEYPSSRFFSHYKDDPAWRIVVKMGLRVPVPDRYSEVPDGLGGTRRITPDEYYEYLRATGPQVKQFIESVGDRLDTLDPATAQTVLSEWTKPIRETELARIYMKAEQNPQ